MKYLAFPLLEKIDNITLHYNTNFHGISEQLPIKLAVETF